jgi:hypothetical protein
MFILISKCNNVFLKEWFCTSIIIIIITIIFIIISQDELTENG